MSGIHLVKVAVDLRLEVPAAMLEARSAGSADLVGGQLARQVDQCVRRRGLGYYPALDYLRDGACIDEDLLEAVRTTAWLAREIAREEVRRRLRAVFSQVELAGLQSPAFTMPAVRPSAPGALESLARHYSPCTVKLGLILSSLNRDPSPRGMDQFARRMIWRWLRDRFEQLDVTSAQIV